MPFPNVSYNAPADNHTNTMKVAFIARSTLYNVHGGDTVQILETAKYLGTSGISVSVFLTNEKINYKEFDLLHFFNITRPADILFHIKKSDKPFVISPVFVDYSEYDKQHRKGISGFILRQLSAPANEYIKTISRWLLNKDKLQSKSYIWKGHKKTSQEIFEKASLLLPNSQSEYEQVKKIYATRKPYVVVPNGIDPMLFNDHCNFTKDVHLVICAGRIEGRKNQLNLIKALNNTEFKLLLIGDAAPNQKRYFNDCKKIAADNIIFTGRISQSELAKYYKRAKVHILPSWFESCGLSSLEAAAMGCNVVITDKGFTRNYFGEDAFYCDPGNTSSILNAVKEAAQSDCRKTLQQRVLQDYTWKKAADVTLKAYESILTN